MPERKGDPGDQIEQNLNVGDSCIPELASSDLGLIPNPLNHQNDQCYIAYMNQYGEIFLYLDLPNGGRVKIVLGKGYYDNANMKWVFTDQYAPEEMIITGDAIAFFTNPLLDDFIKGIREGLRALFNQGISDYVSIYEALSNANSMVEAGYFDSFKNISLGTDENDATSFMKHAIIGGYIASKMLNFGVKNEDNINNMMGFWVSFFAERAQIWYGNSHKIPMKSTPDELGLIDIANFCKILAIAENGDGSVEGDVFTTHNNNQMNVSYPPNKNNYWLFGSNNGLIEIDFTKVNYEGFDNITKFVNIGAGIGILFSFIKDSTPDGIGFHTKLRLYDWLCAGRSYNGDQKVRTGKDNITYNHAKKLMKLINTLYKGKFGQDDMTAFNRQLEELADNPDKRSLDVFYPGGERPSIP